MARRTNSSIKATTNAKPTIPGASEADRAVAHLSPPRQKAKHLDCFQNATTAAPATDSAGGLAAAAALCQIPNPAADPAAAPNRADERAHYGAAWFAIRFSRRR